MSQLEVLVASGEQVRRYIDDLARLRIAVFREFPYLYDGSLAYERGYLEHYANAPGGVVVVARDHAQGSGREPAVVGASTAMPLRDYGDKLPQLFEAANIDPASVFYFGESVLSPAYRGRGLGHVFFDQREAAARARGFSVAAFCAVQRPTDHARRPDDYVPHDAFWRRRGYQRRADLHTTFAWRDLDEENESAKEMVFWLKELSS